jgi:ATP-binding cassette subfamily B protein
MNGQNGKKLKALYSYTKGFRYLIVISFLLMVAEILLTFVTPLVMSVTIDSVLDSKPLNVPGYFMRFLALFGGIETLRAHLWIMAVIMVAFRLLGGLIGLFRTYLNSKASEGAINRLRDRFYSHVQKLPFSYHVSAQTGDLIQRGTTDIETTRRFLSGMFLEFIRTIALLIIGVFVMSDLHVPLTVITLSLSPLLFWVSVVYFKRIQKLFIGVEETEGGMYSVIQENLTGTRVVRAFGRQRFELDKFTEKNEKLRDGIINLNNKFADLWGLLDLISGVQIGLVAIFGIYFAVSGSLTLGQFTAFSSYVFIFLWPIRGFGRVLSDFGRTLIAVGRVEEVLNEKEEPEVENGLTPPISGDIVFKDVDFAYESEKNILSKLSMTIPGGGTVAILGGTGSGKSSLVQLLQRLYDIDGGEISIGGVDINRIMKKHLRGRIGIVLQEPFLYSKTIRDNIAIKMKEPDIGMIHEAAGVAAIHDDILEFEDGYDTVVGERGVTLSGGQKQRIAIARALINDSDILIFDDSLSAVDSKTDAQIRDALAKRRQGVTTIIISHRITTLMEADKIFVMGDGRILEEGTHDELVSRGGLYKRTYEIQSSQVE